MAHVLRVHPDHARVEPLGKGMGAGDVAGPQVGGQPIVHVVGDVQRFLLRVEGDGGEKGAEDLFPGDAHGPVGVAEKRGLEVVPVRRVFRAYAAGHQRGAFFPPRGHVTQDLLEMQRVDQGAQLGGRVEGVAQADTLHAFREPADEIVIDVPFHQHPAAGGAPLPVEAVDHEHRGVQGPVQVRVGEDDHRVLAAQFEMHALEGFGALPHDGAAGPRVPHEADGLDVRVLGEGPPRGLADAVDHVDHTRRQARLVDQFGQAHGRDRAPFGGFVHHGAARRQRGRHLPRTEHEGRVPGRDDAHGSDRLPQGIVQVPGRRQGQSVGSALGTVGEEPEVLGGARRGLGHESDGLARIAGLQEGDLFTMRFDQVGDPVQQFLSFGAGRIPPVPEGGLCRAGRGIDLLRSAVRHGAKHGIVDGRGVLEGAAADGCHGRTADEMADALFAEPGHVPLRFRLVRMNLVGYDTSSSSRSTTSFSRAPSPSTSSRSRSPAWMWEMPSGVPDQIMSPGFRVM